MADEDDEQTHEQRERPMGKQTLALKAKKLDTHAALESKKLDLESKKLDLADKDKERDDRRATIKVVLGGMTGLCVLLLLAFALYYNRAFVFEGFGIKARTAGESSPALDVTPSP